MLTRVWAALNTIQEGKEEVC